jgi:TatD DNase family protein
MFVDSHCHINFPEFTSRLPEVLGAMAKNQVSHALCVGVNFAELPSVLNLAAEQPNIYASVGVHPDHDQDEEPTVERLTELAATPKVVAIGETGLDYFRLTGDLEWQRERFRTHIRAAIATGKPLIIHTRSASEDTLRIMREEHAEKAGGVMHCFTETREVAQAAMELGFYISFSGILTFKNAKELKEVAKVVPLEKMLIETDSPYLAPVPFRGKVNEPAFVVHVAEEVARLKEIPVQEVARATTANFFKLFQDAEAEVVA